MWTSLIALLTVPSKINKIAEIAVNEITQNGTRFDLNTRSEMVPAKIAPNTPAQAKLVAMAAENNGPAGLSRPTETAWNGRPTELIA